MNKNLGWGKKERYFKIPNTRDQNYLNMKNYVGHIT